MVAPVGEQPHQLSSLTWSATPAPTPPPAVKARSARVGAVLGDPQERRAQPAPGDQLVDRVGVEQVGEGLRQPVAPRVSRRLAAPDGRARTSSVSVPDQAPQGGGTGTLPGDAALRRWRSLRPGPAVGTAVSAAVGTAVRTTIGTAVAPPVPRHRRPPGPSAPLSAPPSAPPSCTPGMPSAPPSAVPSLLSGFDVVSVIAASAVLSRAGQRRP